MSKKLHEILNVPPEFSNDGVTEYSEPPDEFNRFAQPEEEEPRPSRTKKVLLLLAAAGLITIGAILPKSLSAKGSADASGMPSACVGSGSTVERGSKDTETTAPLQTEHPTDPAAPAETPAATEIPTATPAPTATPEPTPKPVPIETPGISITFFRRSQVYCAYVRLSKPEDAIRAELQICDPDIEQPAIEHTFTPEELAGGWYSINDYEPYDFYFEHSEEYGQLNREPELIIRVTAVYRTETGEETLTDSSEAKEELWVDYGFDSEEDRTILEMLYGTVYPDCFVIRIFEAPIDDLQVLLNADESELEPGGVSVSIAVDGVTLTDEGSSLLKDEYMYRGQKLYDYVLLIPRPDTIPAHGIAHYTIRQRLIHDEFYQIKERDKDY